MKRFLLITLLLSSAIGLAYLGRPRDSLQDVRSADTNTCSLLATGVDYISCDPLREFDNGRVLVTLKTKPDGMLVFLLAHPKLPPIRLNGIVITSSPERIAVLENDNLVLYSEDGVGKNILKFDREVARANSSASEGTFSPNQERVALFLVPIDNRDADSVAIGIVDLVDGSVRRFATSKWQSLRWINDDLLAVDDIQVAIHTLPQQ